MGCDLGKDGKNEVAREEACQEDAPESKKKHFNIYDKGRQGYNFLISFIVSLKFRSTLSWLT